jgi:trans-2-enoyl-CoA reductase
VETACFPNGTVFPTVCSSFGTHAKTIGSVFEHNANDIKSNWKWFRFKNKNKRFFQLK